MGFLPSLFQSTPFGWLASLDWRHLEASIPLTSPRKLDLPVSTWVPHFLAQHHFRVIEADAVVVFTVAALSLVDAGVVKAYIHNS